MVSCQLHRGEGLNQSEQFWPKIVRPRSQLASGKNRTSLLLQLPSVFPFESIFCRGGLRRRMVGGDNLGEPGINILSQDKERACGG